MPVVVSRFLGLLHMEVFHQRLEQEHGANVITTTPTVPYSIEHTDGTFEEIQNPSQVSITYHSPQCRLQKNATVLNGSLAAI